MKSEPTQGNPLTSITAMILAGGRGTRLRPVIGQRQKVIAELGGQPFLARLLEQLRCCGIRRTILCTGFQGKQVASRIGSTYGGMQLCYSREPRPLGTAGALRHACGQIRSQTVLVMNGDSYFPVDLGRVWQWHQRTGARHTLVLCRVPDMARYGQVALDSNDAVVRFNEKGAAQGPGWISAGIYLLDRSCIEAIPENRCVSIEQEVFPQLAGNGLYGYRGRGNFIDIGTPDSFHRARKRFAQAAH